MVRVPAIRVIHVRGSVPVICRSRVHDLVLFPMELAPILVPPRNVRVIIRVVPVVPVVLVLVPGVPLGGRVLAGPGVFLVILGTICLVHRPVVRAVLVHPSVPVAI